MYDIEFLKKCDDVYYNSGDIIVSDLRYDDIKSVLREEFPNDPYFKSVGAAVDGVDFPLPYVLGSLNKLKADGTTKSWVDSVNIKTLACSAKIDGVSVYLQFAPDGKCSLASTRGNGYVGKNITEKIKKICPNIQLNDFLDTRCEAVMETSKALELGYKNARNAVSGILNSSSGENIEHIKLIFYHIFNRPFIFYSDHIKSLEALGLTVPPNFCIEVYDETIEETLKEKLRLIKEVYQYEIDGLVIANDLDPMIGEDYYPQNVSAFKVNSEAIPATVLSVEWGVGRTGKLTPVVHITPTDINGATVSKATGFNARFIELNTIAQGAVIGIQRSGDVIPNITECILMPTNTTEFLPNNCPYCNTPLEFSKTGIDLYCPNEYCTEKMIYVIENFLLSYGCEEITSTTLKNLNITAISDLFSLTVPDIMKIEGFGESRANQIVTEIRKCLNTTPDKMLKSFGISGIGNTISKTLTNLYSMDELFTMPAEKFVYIEGMGLVLSNNLVDGLRKNLPLYLFLLTRGLEFKELDSNKFKGKSFTLTGKSTMKRDDIVNFIESNGGMVKSISKTTSYLVTNDPNSSSSKTKKAREYGTKIISYDELMNF